MKKPIITIILAAINIGIFLFLSFFGMTENAEFMVEHGAMFVPYVLEQGEYYRIFTSMFLHFGFQHLMNNMVMLAAIGWNLESKIGKVKFLIIYFISGICGTLLSMWQDIQLGTYAVSAGASGAIFGLVGATLYVAVRNRGQVGSISGRGLLIMMFISLYYGYSDSGVDNFAHIGGLLSGIVLALLLYRKRESEPGIFAGF